jgi:hypothetical protein
MRNALRKLPVSHASHPNSDVVCNLQYNSLPKSVLKRTVPRKSVWDYDLEWYNGSKLRFLNF